MSLRLGVVLAFVSALLVVEVPLSVSRVATFKNHLETSKKAIVFTPSIRIGVSL